MRHFAKTLIENMVWTMSICLVLFLIAFFTLSHIDTEAFNTMLKELNDTDWKLPIAYYLGFNLFISLIGAV